MFDEVLASLTAMVPPAVDRGALADKLHVRVVGSYLRGRPDSGDIDYIIAPR